MSAILLLAYSSFILLLKIAVTAFLLWQLIRIFNNPLPYPNYVMLTYHERWVLHGKDHQERIYEKGRVVVSIGLFFLFELSGKNKKKLIVIFRDQIEEHSYRLLGIIEKIQPKLLD